MKTVLSLQEIRYALKKCQSLSRCEKSPVGEIAVSYFYTHYGSTGLWSFQMGYTKLVRFLYRVFKLDLYEKKNLLGI